MSNVAPVHRDVHDELARRDADRALARRNLRVTLAERRDDAHARIPGLEDEARSQQAAAERLIEMTVAHTTLNTYASLQAADQAIEEADRIIAAGRRDAMLAQAALRLAVVTVAQADASLALVSTHDRDALKRRAHAGAARLTAARQARDRLQAELWHHADDDGRVLRRLNEAETEVAYAEADARASLRAWTDLLEAEREARVAGRPAPTMFCWTCGFPLADTTEPKGEFCSASCADGYEEFTGTYGTRCCTCNVHFIAPTGLESRFCSRRCLEFAAVDLEEFGGVDFSSFTILPPWPATRAQRVALVRRARERQAALSRAADLSGPATAPGVVIDCGFETVAASGVRALPSSALDRYVAFLRVHGPVTDAEAAKAIPLPASTVRRLHHEHGALFVSDGRPRGARWGLRG